MPPSEDPLQDGRHPQSVRRVGPPDSGRPRGDRANRAAAIGRRPVDVGRATQLSRGDGRKPAGIDRRPDDDRQPRLHDAHDVGRRLGAAAVGAPHAHRPPGVGRPPAALTLPRGGRRCAATSTRIVMETLRLEQSEYLYRETTRDIEHKGVVIPRGWLVRLCVRESHQDPAIFANPDVFDPDRFLIPDLHQARVRAVWRGSAPRVSRRAPDQDGGQPFCRGARRWLPLADGRGWPAGAQRLAALEAVVGMAHRHDPGGCRRRGLAAGMSSGVGVPGCRA